MIYMHNMVRKDEKGFTWCLVFFDSGTQKHVYKFIKIR